MDFTQWHAIVLGSITFFAMILWGLRCIFRVITIHGHLPFLKHISYPQLIESSPICGGTTRFHAILILGLVTSNALYIALQKPNVGNLISRSGLMSTANFILLSLGSHLQFLFPNCGIASQDYDRIHQWIGAIALIECLMHSAISIVSGAHTSGINTLSQILGWVAISAISLMLVSSISIFRRFWYEIFAVFHRLLAATIILSVWLHLPSRQLITFPSLNLLGATLIWTLTLTFWLIGIAYRNIRYGKNLARANLVKAGDVVLAHIRIPRSWDVKAGQYVRLCIPGVSTSAFLQWHPFMISWWYYEGHDMVIVLIIEKRKGFTESLKLCAGPGTGITALIDGPYGRDLHLSTYGTVLLFASGIGIAGQLPYVRQLLQEFYMCKTNCRRIVLFWEMNLQAHVLWAASYLSELLREDTDCILDIRLYIVEANLPASMKRGGSLDRETHTPINIFYEEIDIETEIPSEVGGKKGFTAVLTCVDDDMGYRIRRIVTKLLEFDVRLVELDFHPELTANEKKRRKESKKKATGPIQESRLYPDSICDPNAGSICPSLMEDKI